MTTMTPMASAPHHHWPRIPMRYVWIGLATAVVLAGGVAVLANNNSDTARSTSTQAQVEAVAPVPNAGTSFSGVGSAAAIAAGLSQEQLAAELAAIRGGAVQGAQSPAAAIADGLSQEQLAAELAAIRGGAAASAGAAAAAGSDRHLSTTRDLTGAGTVGASQAATSPWPVGQGPGSNSLSASPMPGVTELGSDRHFTALTGG